MYFSIQFGNTYRFYLPKELDEPTLNRQRVATARNKDGVVTLFRDGQHFVLNTETKPANSLEKDAVLGRTILADRRRSLPMTHRIALKLLDALRGKINDLKDQKQRAESADGRFNFTAEKEHFPMLFSYQKHYDFSHLEIGPLSASPVRNVNKMLKGWFLEGKTLNDYVLDQELTQNDQPYQRAGETLDGFLSRALDSANGNPHIYLYFKNKDNPNKAISVFYTLRPTQGGLYQKALVELRSFSFDGKAKPELDAFQSALQITLKSEARPF